MRNRSRKNPKNEVVRFPGHDATLQDVWESKIQEIYEFTSSLFQYSKELPGFCDIFFEDFSLAINDRVLYIYAVTHNDLIIDDESFITFRDIQMCRRWIYQVMNKEFVDRVFYFHKIFKDLKLTPNEKALVIPIILTTPAGIFNLEDFKNSYQELISCN